MKVKLSKRMLCAMLSLIMALTSIPFIGLSLAKPESASAAVEAIESSDPYLPLIDALNNYSVTLRNLTTVKTNMKQAYDAYLDARKYYDLCKVGADGYTFSEDEMNQKISALETAIGKMGDYSSPTLATSAADGSYTSEPGQAHSLVSGDQLSNALYTDGVSDKSNYVQSDYDGASGIQSNKKTQQGAQYGTAVFLYDGNTMAMPVTVFGKGLSYLGQTTGRTIAYMYPSSTDLSVTVSFNQMSHGYATGSPGYQTQAINKLNHKNTYVSTAVMPKTNQTVYYSNTMYIDCTLGDKEYSKEINTIVWNFQQQENNKLQHNAGTISASAIPLFIVNYIPVQTRLAEAVYVEDDDTLSGLSLLTSTSTDKALQYISAIDRLTGIPYNSVYGNDDNKKGNSSNYTYTREQVKSVANEISGAVNDYDGIKNELLKNPAGIMYTLSDTVEDMMTIYNNGNTTADTKQQIYTNTTWNNFVKAYDAAIQAVKDVKNNGYTLSQTEIDKLQSDLDAAYFDLTYFSEDVADTTIFDQARAIAKGLTNIYYTAKSFNALLEVVEEQFNIIYPDGEQNLPVRKEEQYKVEQAALAVMDAIKALRLNTTSLDELISEAKNYNSNDYINYAQLAEAIGVAQQYSDSLKVTDYPTLPDNEIKSNNYMEAEAKEWNAYQDHVNALREAIKKLTLAFTTMPNGEIVNETIGDTEASTTGNNNSLSAFLAGVTTQKTVFRTNRKKLELTTPYNIAFNNTAGYGYRLHFLAFSSTSPFDKYAYEDGSTMTVTWKEGGSAKKSDNFDAGLTYHGALTKSQIGDDTKNYINITQEGNLTVLGDITTSISKVNENKEYTVEDIKIYNYASPPIHYYFAFRSGNNHKTFDGTFSNLTQTITVIDVVPLFEKIDEANQFLAESFDNAYGCYDQAKYADFIAKLGAAKKDMEYKTMSNDAIVNECQTRYNNLNSALEAVKAAINPDGEHNYSEITVDGTTKAPTCTETGTAVYLCGICSNQKTDTNVAALGHDYIYDSEPLEGTDEQAYCGKHYKYCSREDCSEHTRVPESCTNEAAEAGSLLCDYCHDTMEHHLEYIQTSCGTHTYDCHNHDLTGEELEEAKQAQKCSEGDLFADGRCDLCRGYLEHDLNYAASDECGTHTKTCANEPCELNTGIIEGCTDGDNSDGKCEFCSNYVEHKFVYSPNLNEDLAGPEDKDELKGDGHSHSYVCENGCPAKSDGYVECVDTLDSNGKCDECGQELYTPADWAVYNSNKNDLLSALESETYTYTAAALKEVKNIVDSASYFDYSTYKQSRTSDKENSQITSERRKLAAAQVKLEENTTNSDAYDDELEKFEKIDNADEYNIDEIRKEVEKAKASVSETITIAGKDYTGYNYDASAETIQTAINNYHYKYKITVYGANKKPYYVTRTNGADGIGYTVGYSTSASEAGEFYYDDAIELKNPTGGEEAVAWSGKVTAKGTNQTQETSYMLTAPTYTFNVRGDTELYTTAKNEEEESKFIQITFINNPDSKVPIAYDYAEIQPDKTIKYNLSDAPVPNRIFFTVDGFKDMANEQTYQTDGTITFDEGTEKVTLLVNYKPEERSGGYEIDLRDESGSSVDGYPKTGIVWNQYITVSIPGAAALKDANTGKILKYGDTYSFYACQSVAIQQVSESELAGHTDTVEVSVISTPVTSPEKRAQFVGFFATKEDITVEGVGIVLDASGNQSEKITLSDVSNAKKVLNLSAPLATMMADNEFAASIGYGKNHPEGLAVSYCAYVIYKDGTGRHTVYSDVVKAELK